VLLVDRQSTGGYTKVATICSSDIWRVGQARPGQSLRFHPIDVDEAHRLLREADRALDAAVREEIA
jgi:allophanate hydrolase subunit 2